MSSWFKTTLLAATLSVATSATTTMGALAPTTFYDADSNVLPNASGQIFQGGTANGPGTARMSLTDLGGGDRVLTFNTQGSVAGGTNNYAYFVKTAADTPTTWNVDRAVGYSVEISLRLDGVQATDGGSATLVFGSAQRAPSLRFVRAAGASTMTVELRSSSTLVASTVITTPDLFHTFRADVLDDNVDLYVDDLPVISDAQDTVAITTSNRILLGDPTTTADGNYQVQFLKTYQSGVVPEPAALGLLGLAALVLQRRRRYR